MKVKLKTDFWYSDNAEKYKKFVHKYLILMFFFSGVTLSRKLLDYKVIGSIETIFTMMVLMLSIMMLISYYKYESHKYKINKMLGQDDKKS